MNKNDRTTPNPGTIVGVTWYRPDQWARLFEVSVDRAGLEPSFESWEAGAKHRLQELRERGLDVRRIDVEVEALVRWCEVEGCELDGRARAQYVAEMARARSAGDAPR